MLLEEFKQCLHLDMLDLKTHLDDKALQDAAVVSKSYTFSHERSFKGPNFNTSRGKYKNQGTEGTVKAYYTDFEYI